VKHRNLILAALAAVLLLGNPASCCAQQKQGAVLSATQPNVAPPDSEHDFDFEFGSWKTKLKRRLRPLTNSSEWVEYSGTSIVRKVWNGRANLVELDVNGPSGHIEGLSLRLYNPETRQWSLNFSNRRLGTLSPPVFGGFKEGRGEFYGQDALNGRAILVRFVISRNASDSYHFEQAFSDDGGKTWEVNWIADDTRISDATAEAEIGMDHSNATQVEHR
jgi:hypothetical protein